MRRIVSTILLLLLLLPLSAQSVKDLQKQQAAIQKQLAETDKMLNETKKNEKATVNKLNILNNSIRERKKLINSINSEINSLDQNIANLTRQSRELETKMEQLRKDYATLIRETHYASIKQSPLLFLCSAENFQQLFHRIYYMKVFTDYRKTQVAEMKETQTEINIQNDLLMEKRGERAEALSKQKSEKEKLARDERKQQSMLKELKKKEKNLASQLKQQQKKIDQLNAKIEQMIKKQTATKSTLTKEQKLLAGGFEANKGRLPWPVEKGFISGYFGTHQHPVYEHVTINNKGIYIQTTAGSDARAVFDGEVSSCIVLGNTYAVIVQHGNYRTVYSNLTQLHVKQGDKVKAKQRLGKILSDKEQDNKTELYFQIYQDRTLLNPSLWLAQ